MPTLAMKGAVAFALALVAAITLPGFATAAPLVIDTYIEVPDCHTTTQVCPEVPTVEHWFTTDTIRVEFTANQNHCSNIIDRILIDGYEWGFRVVGPGQSDEGQVIPIHPVPGYHTIGVKAEGIEGGCNVGYLSSWGGMLHIEELP
jgi:hypothetical protein